MSYEIYFQRNLILVHNSHIHPQACKDFDRCMKIVFLAKPFINSYFTCIYMIYKCHIKLYRSFFPVSSLITMLKLPPPAITTFHQNFWVMEEPLVVNITDLFHYCIYSGCWLVKVRGFIVYILIYKYIAFLVCQNVQYIIIWLVNLTLSFSLSYTYTHEQARAHRQKYGVYGLILPFIIRKVHSLKLNIQVHSYLIFLLKYLSKYKVLSKTSIHCI